MARDLAGRLLFKGHLRTESPLHVGGMGNDPSVDMPLARDGLGRLYVPGTSLAGALRAWLEQRLDSDVVREFCGYQSGDKGQASPWIVEDMILPEETERQLELRQGVGINRLLGAAHPGVLYDRAVIPRGAILPLVMSIEISDSGRWEAAKSLLGHLLSALAEAAVPLGAARSGGLGRVRLVDDPVYAPILAEDFQTLGGMLGALRRIARERGENSPAQPDELLSQTGGLPEETGHASNTMSEYAESKDGPIEPAEEDRDVPVLRACPRIEIELCWKPAGPIMVKDGREGLVADALPRLERFAADEFAPVLPGTSIKGALRACAERVVRTVLEMQSPPLPGGRAKQFQLDLERVPLVTDLFGAPGAAGSTASGATQPGNPAPGLSALWVDDCHAAPIRENAWNAITEAESGEKLVAAIGSSGQSQWTPAYHVAVDRWTGGAADGALFCVLEPWGSNWEPIRMTLQLSRLKSSELGPALALLRLTLREVELGRVPLGYSTNRGMGDMEIQSIRLTATELSSSHVSQLGLQDPEGQTIDIGDRTFCGSLEQHWKRWLAVHAARQERTETEATRNEK